MRDEDQIRGWIAEAKRRYEWAKSNKELKYPEIPMVEYKAQISVLKWVLEEAPE